MLLGDPGSRASHLSEPRQQLDAGCLSRYTVSVRNALVEARSFMSATLCHKMDCHTGYVHGGSHGGGM